MWTKCFKVVNIIPGRVHTSLLGMIDFANPDIPVEKIQQLYENDSPYLEITPYGIEKLYTGVKAVAEESTPVVPEFEPETTGPEFEPPPVTKKPRTVRKRYPKN